MPPRLFQFLFPSVILVVVPPFAEACRYSVRDVGFVEIHPDPYRLRFFGDSVGSATGIDNLLPIARIALEGSNIVAEAADLDDFAGHPGAEYVEGALQKGSIALLLESPDLEIRPRPIPDSPSPDSQFWSSSLESLVSSPVRERYLERMHEIYGAILFIESEDEQANDKARATTEEAVKKTKDYMTQIPKPVNEPPEVFAIPNDGSEGILLWSLGIEDRRTPHVAVLFGRGRRIGEVLSGGDITPENLFEILSVVGLDCECGLDRSWMQGTCVPLRWDEETQEKTARALDFDPENPMVKMEISQILSQGGTGTRRAEGGASDPFFGYSERSVSFKEFAFETDNDGSESELPSTPPKPSTASLVSEKGSSPLSLPSLPAVHTAESPKGRPYVFAIGILISLGLSIFAVGFYILFRSRRLEP